MRAILTYHSLDPSGSPISVDPDAFRRHVAWLTTSGPPVVPLRSLVSDVRDDDHALALTFDDGFTSFADVAAPLLAEHGLPATLFVVTRRVGETNEWEGRAQPGIPTFDLMDWTRLGTMQEMGFDIGAHTRTHARLTNVSDAHLADEIDGCREDLETRLGVTDPPFCYPYGAVDDRVTTAARRSYDLAVTTELSPLDGADRLRLPRLDMVYFRDPRRLEAWGSPALVRYLGFRRAGRRMRSVLSRLSGAGQP